MFSYLSPEQRVPADHPLRAVRALTDEALQTMSRRFASLYATTGRPSIPPEQWLRALLLQVLYTVRSERLLMEELNDNLLFRWFVGLNMDDPVWHPTTFTKNRDRLLSGDVAAAFFDAVQAHARAAGLLSDEHFTVDGTQLEAWASLKSFRCVDAAESDPPEDPGNPTVNFHGERRRNDTHQSTTDPEAMLHRKGKGKEAKLAYLGHVLLDNRQGLVANVCATHATGTAERDAAVLLLEASASPGSTVGADKGYDVARFVADVRVQDVTPHVAQKVRGSAIDGRTTRHAGYHVSQRKRTLVEQVFGWMKTVGGLRKLRHRGIALVDWQLTFAATAYNFGPVAESGGEVSLIAGRGCRWPPRRDSVSPCAPLSGGGRDTHDGHENSPILVFFSNLLGSISGGPVRRRLWLAPRRADNPSMTTRPEAYESDVEVPPVVFCDRRQRPDRRVSWRGGRRDSDWLNRPPGVLDRFQRLQRGRVWRRVIQTSRAFVGQPERPVHNTAA